MKYRYDRLPPNMSEEERAYAREAARSELWHATYNAVINALYIRGGDSTQAEYHNKAAAAANGAHGEI
jgi:hypothetical protein